VANLVRSSPAVTIEQAMQIALAHHEAGRLAEAEAIYRQVLAQVPQHAGALHLLGTVALQTGHLDAAIDLIGRALALNPGLAEAHCNRAEALRRAGRLDDAIAAFDQAIALDPGLASAHLKRGVALHQASRTRDAIEAYERALALEPGGVDALGNLAVALHQTGRRDEALAASARALELHPGSATAHYNRGHLLGQRGCLDDAAAALRRAIALDPGFAEAHCNLGNVLKEQGSIDDAIACYRRAHELNPALLEAASNLVFNLHYHPGYDARAILAEHRRWARQYAEPLAGEIARHPNDRAPDRKLRVGFLSPDLRGHPVGYALVPLFAHRDRLRYEFVAYCDSPHGDDITHRLRALADGWHEIAGRDDRQVVEQIRRDQIDLLVDPTLHTLGNRILVFARKPAPVQVTMLGPPVTTGLATMDYRVTDPYLDPPGSSDDDYVERSVRLPHCFWVYSPPADAPGVSPLPAARQGSITFGCLNQLFKVSRPVWSLWREVLRAVPGARLLVQSHPGSHLARLRADFEEGGIAPGRLEFVAPAARTAYFARFHDLDIALDPFPYNGHTSTLDALWMGVPVVTLAGRTAVGRGGVSILTNAGLPELIAGTPDDYVRIAVELAGDLKRLATLRAGLRPRIEASPLVDGKQYAADVEAAFRWMWQAWCERSPLGDVGGRSRA
jgi:predicted O-linked N-acetylglucosamine transferase (SPINDLY family)